MNAKSKTSRLIPVLIKGRKAPKIPFRQSSQECHAAQKEEEMLATFREGTTPQGRELLHKLLYFVEKSFWSNRPLEEIIAHAERELGTFSALRGEWLLLLGRIRRAPKFVELERSEPHPLALIIVYVERFKWAQKIARRQRALPFADAYEERRFQRWKEMVIATKC